jgi:hypothetical protein
MMVHLVFSECGKKRIGNSHFFLGPFFFAAFRLFSVAGLVLCGGGTGVWFGGYFGGLCLNQDILFPH